MPHDVKIITPISPSNRSLLYLPCVAIDVFTSASVHNDFTPGRDNLIESDQVQGGLAEPQNLVNA